MAEIFFDAIDIGKLIQKNFLNQIKIKNKNYIHPRMKFKNLIK